MAAHGRAFSLAEAWALFEPLAEALAHAHRSLVVHRDLKPANVMVVRDPAGNAVPRVIDFGVAKAFAAGDAAGGGGTMTASPHPFTPAYAAPEQITQARSGPWTDVHALALLLVELVTGAPPYGRGADARLAIVDPERPTPRARGVDVGPLEPVLAKALALRPANRFADAGALLDAARAAMAAGAAHAPALAPRAPIAGPTPSTEAPASHTLPVNAPPPRVSRRIVVGGSIAAAGLLLALGGVAIAPRLRPRAPAPPVPVPSTPSAAPRTPTLASMTTEDLDARLAAAGIKVDYRTHSAAPARVELAMWMHGTEAWTAQIMGLNVVATPEKSRAQARLDAVGAAVAAFRTTHRVVYGAEDATIAMVYAPSGGRDELVAVFDRLFGDIALLVRGTTFDATNDVTVREAQVKDAPLTAKNLRELSLEELAQRLRNAGVETKTTWQASADMSTIYFQRGGASGTALAYRKDGKVVLPGLIAQGGTQVYAVDGDALVLLQGDGSFCKKSFLAKVLDGLHADVVEHIR